MSVITMIPNRDSGNAYNELLYRALESVGLRYVQIPYSLGYLLRHPPRTRFHYLHFHWPEIFFVIRPRQPHKLFGLKGFLVLHSFWILARLRGYRLVWTVHEVDAHDLERQRWIHAASRRLLWKLADLVFTHTQAVRDEAVRRWGARPHLHTLPIGDYVSAYPDTLTRAEARARLGIPAPAFTFLFFGKVRPYKGADILIDAFRALVRDFPAVHLVVCGQPSGPEYGAQIRAAAERLPNVHLVLEYVPDEDVQVYLRAADWLVAPYKTLETTSVLYLALAFQLPVVITAAGNAAEFEPLGVGIFLRDPGETEGALRRILEMPAEAREVVRDNVRRAARHHSWDRLKHEYRAAFDAWEASRRGAATLRLPGDRQPVP